MTRAVVIDSNLLALLIVGGTSRSYISVHKSTNGDFDVYDYDLLTVLLKDFSEILLVAHVVAETSSLVRKIGEPRQTEIQRVFARFVSRNYEVPVASISGLRRSESVDLGVTDGVLLHLCSIPIGGQTPTLLTVDGPLTDRAIMAGCSVINYKREFKISSF